MAPVIRIPEDVFKRLQQHAVPFEDTPASVINRLLDFFDSHPDASVLAHRDKKGHRKIPDAETISEIAREAVRSVGLTPGASADLRHSKIIKAKLGDETANDWAELHRLAHRLAFLTLGSLEALQQRVSWEIPKGKRRAKGFEYGYIEDLGFSVRGVDAETAWKRSRELAELCALPILVTAITANNKQINLEWVPKRK